VTLLTVLLRILISPNSRGPSFHKMLTQEVSNFPWHLSYKAKVSTQVPFKLPHFILTSSDSFQLLTGSVVDAWGMKCIETLTS
jgi:hypothetical protein